MTKFEYIRVNLLGLSQVAMGEVLGVTQSNVWFYENRGQELPPKRASKLIQHAASLGIELDYDDIYGEQDYQAS
jgi:transcriptional regulator with XRE-family HTH domain